jgi:hypothetical protein
MTITLTTLGSRGLTVDVAPAALSEAGDGGVQLELGLYDGPLTISFTKSEALDLLEILETQAHADWPAIELVSD